jgi:hypothetical protein
MKADMGQRDAETGGWRGEDEGHVTLELIAVADGTVNWSRSSSIGPHVAIRLLRTGQPPVAWTGKTLMTLPVAQLRSLHGASALR